MEAVGDPHCRGGDRAPEEGAYRKEAPVTKPTITPGPIGPDVDLEANEVDLADGRRLNELQSLFCRLLSGIDDGGVSLASIPLPGPE